MTDIRKYTIILTVAILFAIFSYSFADAFTTQAIYPDFCQESQDYRAQRIYDNTKKNCSEIAQPTEEEYQACPGEMYQDYSSCNYVCNCYEITNDNREANNQLRFYIGTILGGLAIIFGMLLSPKKKLNTWIGSGFILGGVITIFIATVGYWGQLDKLARPILIAVELGLVLWIAYKKFQ